MKDNQIENRIYSSELQIRSSESEQESRTVEGYALLFEHESKDFGGWTEVISRNSLEGVIEKSDVFALLNHDKSRGVLARSKYGEGTLKLTIDERGLKYEFDAPKTALGDELLEMLRRGDISESSFAFTIGEDSWERISNEKHVRTIKQFDRLFDVSPVYVPAYTDTQVKNKRYGEIIEEERKQELQSYFEEKRKTFKPQHD